MRNLRILSGILLFALLMAFTGLAENKFTGAKFCGACHKAKDKGETYTIWEKSKHSKAFETLKTKEADEIAKKKGLSKPAAESPECLKCHVTGGGAATNVEAGFKKEEGVTCEACHGAASAYKMVHNKPNSLDKAKAAGLVLSDNTDPKPCEKCHNAESPTHKPFKMAEMWAQIEHKLPPKK